MRSNEFGAIWRYAPICPDSIGRPAYAETANLCFHEGGKSARSAK